MTEHPCEPENVIKKIAAFVRFLIVVDSTTVALQFAYREEEEI
jgi:hypothetical protein